MRPHASVALLILALLTLASCHKSLEYQIHGTLDNLPQIKELYLISDMENGIPFKMTLPKTPYAAERGYRAMVEMSESAEKNGLSDMTLDEINAEIDASRKERQTASK